MRFSIPTDRGHLPVLSGDKRFVDRYFDFSCNLGLDYSGAWSDPAVVTVTVLDPTNVHSPAALAATDQLNTLRVTTSPHAAFLNKPGTSPGSTQSAILAAEPPLRGTEFVTRKITMHLAALARGGDAPVELGNMDAQRDWGFAGDYVEGMWRMLQQDEADDYVLATGVTTSIRDFFTFAAEELGMDLDWQGEGVREIAIDRKSGKQVMRVNPKFYRPAEVDLLQQLQHAEGFRRARAHLVAVRDGDRNGAPTSGDERHEAAL